MSYSKRELIGNLPMFIKRQDLSRLFFFKEIYEKIVNIHGMVIEFGVRWGKFSVVSIAHRNV